MMTVLKEQSTVQTKRRSRRRWLFRGVICLAAWGLCEAGAWGLLSFRTHHGMACIHAEQVVMASSGVDQTTQGESLHPYVGWVLNPDIHPGSSVNGETLRPNRWGFFGTNDVPRRSNDQVIIGITGGSVAWQMSTGAEEQFRQVLQGDPRLAGKDIRIVTLALPGYKQPQQLMTLNYFLALGFELDVLINIDGYNEAALPSCENYVAGVALIYPRAWHARMQNLVDPREYAVSFELFEIRAKRQQLAQNMLDSPIHWSPLRNLVWSARDTRLQNRLIELGSGLKDRRNRRGRGFSADGPTDDELDEPAMEAEVVAIWERCSRQLQHLCEANGIHYLHCLQPNQYLEGSKPLSDEEREKYFDPEQDQGQVVNRLYPVMIATGEDLKLEEIDFHDLTLLFSDVEETVYADYFCHYNQRGNDMLANAVARRLTESW